MSDAAGIFPPGTARHGPPSQKRRDACKRIRARYLANNVRWTDDLDGELMEYISRGYSFGQTAKLMGLSDSQVSGRFARLRFLMGEQAV